MRFPPPHFFKFGGSPSQQQPGFQLLATCKDMFWQRRKIFYSYNTFTIPPGPIVIASSYFNNLDAENIILIKSLRLTFTVADLTPEGFQHVDEDIRHWKQLFGRSARKMDRAQQIAAWMDCSMVALNVLWWRKLQWLLQWPTGLDNLHKVELRGCKYKLIMKGPHVERVLTKKDHSDALPILWRSCESMARKQLREQFEKCEMVLHGGRVPKALLNVDPVRGWLYAQAPGIRCKTSAHVSRARQKCISTAQLEG